MKKNISAGLLILAVLAACGKNGKFVARIGSDTITFKALQERIQDAPPAYRNYLATSAGKKQFLDLMVRERVVLESAKAAKYDKKDNYKKAMSEFKKEQVRRSRDYAENLLMELYIRDLHDSKKIGATEEEVQRYYDDHRDDFVHPKEVKARHILVATRAKAEKALERLKNGENFAKVAREVSTDPVSAAHGGEIGPFTKGQLVPEFENAVFALKTGQISPITETHFGYHIIMKVAEKTLPARPIEDALPDIRKTLEKSKFDAWFEDAKKKQGVKVNYEILNQVSPPLLPLSMQQDDKPAAQPVKK